MTRSIASSNRHNSRLRLGEAAVLPVPQAVALLPLADREAREWLIENKLIRHLRGRSVIIWGEVLRVLARNGDTLDSPPSTRQAKRTSATLKRADLGGE